MPDSEQMTSEVLTLSEIASYLKVSKKTILRMAQAGEIPSLKVSGQWRFLRSFIDDWLQTRLQLAGRDSLARVITTAEAIIPVSRLVSPERIVTDIESGTKEAVLRRLVRPLVDANLVTDGANYLQRLRQREEMVSTAVGQGVAFPHVRSPEETNILRPCIVFGICPEGTDFDSLDGEPTYVFALCCSNSEVVHLRLLAKMTLLLRKEGIVDRLRKSDSPKDVMSELVKADCELTMSL